MSVRSVSAIFIAIFIIGTVWAEQISLGSHRKCVPGSVEQIDECNECYCSNRGTLDSCTFRDCDKVFGRKMSHKNAQKREIKEPVINGPGYKCEPKSRFKHECNDCTCNEDGTFAACTYKLCIDLPKTKRETKSNGRCADGRLALCRSEAGLARCRLVACPNDKQKRETKQECEPGKVFKAADGCNTCRCSDTGKIVMCTLMACPQIQPAHNFQKRQTDYGKRCIPNTSFTADDGCNTCRCSANGRVVGCTRKACTFGRYKRDVEKSEEPKRCTPNSTFKMGCQTCYCNDKGVVVTCVSQSCRGPPGPSGSNGPIRNTRETKKVCEPKSTFQAKDGCNTCTCNDDGTNAACTLRACIQKRETTVQVCEPNKTFLDKDGCNTCRCNDKGTFAACTLKLCPPTNPKHKRSAPVVVEVRGDISKVQCDADKKYKYQCNDCECVKGALECTRKLCSEGEEVTSDIIMITDDPNTYTCEFGKQYQYQCNTCQCVKGNKLACTRIDCGGVRKTRSVPTTDEIVQVTGDIAQYKCEAGKAYRFQCNDCTCDDGKLTCTRKVCPIGGKHKRSADDEEIEVTGNVWEFKCEPGKKYKQACNKCTCTKEGLACTRRICLDRKKRDTTDVIQVTGDVMSYKCEQGKKYRYNCNNCRCLNDGKLACTRRVCGPTEKQKREAEEVIQVTRDQINNYKCENDKKYRYECNECRCLKEKLACTRRMCAPGETRRKREEKKPKIGDPDYRCVPGTTFKDDDNCNDCFCAANGRDVGCTDKLCPKPKPAKRETKPKIGDPDYTCTPGTTFLDDEGCNTCFCADDGKSVGCTEKYCLKKGEYKRSTKPKIGDPDYICTPGTSFLDDEGCNTCSCGDDGKSVRCTEKLCIKKGQYKRSTKPRIGDPNYRCTPGSTFMDDEQCNECQCAENGKDVFCTDKECNDFIPSNLQKRETKPKIGDPGYTCTPGTTFLDDEGCNTCFCADDGKSVGCTEKYCLKKGEYKRSTSECTVGETKTMQCNTCTCEKVGWVCTKRLCPDGKQA